MVGDADDEDLFDAGRAAEPERRLGREVNIHWVPFDAWTGTDDGPFLSSVRSRPPVPLDL